MTSECAVVFSRKILACFSYALARTRSVVESEVAVTFFTEILMIRFENIHWHTIAVQFLDQHSNVLDLGANLGQFSQAITKRLNCHCVAVEPAPVPFDLIPSSKYISKKRLAIGAEDGVRKFHFDKQNPVASSFSAEGELEVEVRTLPSLMNELGWSGIDLLKADIEGAEIELLASCSDDFLKKNVRQLTIEFHDFCGFVPVKKVRESIDRLRDIGLYGIRMSRFGHQDTWFVNSHLLPVSAGEMSYHRIVTRNFLGAKRVAKRLLGSTAA